MSQNTLDRLVILALLFSITAGLISLFAEMRAQKEEGKKERDEKDVHIQIQKLQKEIELLKLRLT